MDEEVLNTSLRRFLKKVGITAQREIEKGVREGIASSKLKGNEALHAKAAFTYRRHRSDVRDRGRCRAELSSACAIWRSLPPRAKRVAGRAGVGGSFCPYICC
jgi:hypothetical protein